MGIAYDDERDVMLKSRKETCKVSDFDVSKLNNIPPSPLPPPVPNRPASYTPSNHDSLNTLNNLDNFHNYGSAADDLENCHNIPYLTQEFLSFHGPPPRSNASVAPSLPPPPPSNPPSDTDSIQKGPWEGDCPNMLENLEGMHVVNVLERCIYSMYSTCIWIVTRISFWLLTEKKHPEKFPRLARPGLLCTDTTSFSSLPVSESEDEPGQILVSEIVSSDLLNNSLISMIIHSSLIKYYKKYIVFEIFHICNIEYRIHIIAPLIFIAWNFSLFPFLFTISPHLHRLLTKKSESALVFGCSLTLIHLHLIVSFC